MLTQQPKGELHNSNNNKFTAKCIFVMISAHEVNVQVLRLTEVRAQLHNLVVTHWMKASWNLIPVCNLTLYLPRGTEGSREKLQRRQTDFGRRTEHGTSRIRSRKANRSAATFCVVIFLYLLLLVDYIA
jgi:hypothetical protein